MLHARSTAFVMDDDEAIGRQVCTLVSSAGITGRHLASFDEFCMMDVLPRPSCLLVDNFVQGQSSSQIQQKLIECGCPIPVLVMAQDSTVSNAVSALKRGAADFIEKPIDPQTLLEAIVACLEIDLKAIEQENSKSKVLSRFARVTMREREVMNYTIQGLSNKVIAHELGISQKTVEAHRAKIMSKMEAKSVVELVRLSGLIGLDEE